MASWLYSTCNTFAFKFQATFGLFQTAKGLKIFHMTVFWVALVVEQPLELQATLLRYCSVDQFGEGINSWQEEVCYLFGATNLLLVRVGKGLFQLPQFQFVLSITPVDHCGPTKRGSKSYDYVLTIWANIYDTMLLVCPSVPGYSILPRLLSQLHTATLELNLFDPRTNGI